MGSGNPEILGHAIEGFMKEWGLLLNVGLGIAALLGLLALGWSITRLIMNADNPAGRSEAINDIMKAGITTACVGGFWSLVWLFYFMFT